MTYKIKDGIHGSFSLVTDNYRTDKTFRLVRISTMNGCVKTNLQYF